MTRIFLLVYIIFMEVKTLQALAEPNRLKIVELLKERPYTVNQIASKLDMRQPQASKHLHILAEANIVNVKRLAQLRIYDLNNQPFLELDDWLNSFNSYWDNKMAALDKYIKQIKQK